MKTLTIISTIFIPLTFIAGVYGMNFKHMPELDWRYGYAAVWMAMVTLTVLLVLWFRRRTWL
jgi:magnesium transporter